jgi:hypothetical protein
MTIKTLAWIFKVVYRTFCNAKDFSIFVLFSKCGVFQQNRHKTYVEETVKGEGGLEFCDRRGDWGRDLCDWTKKAETILSYVQTCRLFPTRPVMRSGCGWSVGHSRGPFASPSSCHLHEAGFQAEGFGLRLRSAAVSKTSRSELECPGVTL